MVNRGPPRFDTRSNQRAHSNRGPPPVNGVRRVTRILGPSRVDRALSKLRFSLVCDGGCVANDSLNERHRFYLLSQRQSQTRDRGRGTGIPNKSLLTSVAGHSSHWSLSMFYNTCKGTTYNPKLPVNGRGATSCCVQGWVDSRLVNRWALPQRGYVGTARENLILADVSGGFDVNRLDQALQPRTFT